MLHFIENTINRGALTAEGNIVVGTLLDGAIIFDSEGNLYFGCHDGAFYSLGPSGKLRWCSLTGQKIYSSPSIFMAKALVFFMPRDSFSEAPAKEMLSILMLSTKMSGSLGISSLPEVR